jgi:hypothetical protein
MAVHRMRDVAAIEGTEDRGSVFMVRPFSADLGAAEFASQSFDQ